MRNERKHPTQILTTGAMEDFSRYLGVNWKLLMCYMFCMFWIFSTAKGKTISEVVGRTVMLPCNNESVSNLTQLTWEINGTKLLSYRPQGNSLHIHMDEKLGSLNMNLSTSKSQLYALIIERLQKSHTGNYTCFTTTPKGLQEETWTLIITGHVDADNWQKLVIPVAATVSCTFCLILIFALTFLRRTCKSAENNSRSPTAVMVNTIINVQFIKQGMQLAHLEFNKRAISMIFNSLPMVLV